MFGHGLKNTSSLGWHRSQRAATAALGVVYNHEPATDMPAPCKRFYNRDIIGGMGAKGGTTS